MTFAKPSGTCIALALTLLLASCSTTRQVAKTVEETTGAVVDTLEESVEFVTGLFTEEEEAVKKIEPPTPMAIATEGANPPFNTTGKDGSVYGLDIELGTALCLELNFECTWYIHNPEELAPGLNARKLDLVISSVPVTSTTQKRMLLSQVYFPFSPGLLARRVTSGMKPDQLNGRSLGLVQDSPAALYAQDNLKETRQTLYPGLYEALAALETGKVEALLHDALMLKTAAYNSTTLAYLGDVPTGMTAAMETEDATGAIAVTAADITGAQEPTLSSGYAIGIRKSTTSTQLLETINQGLANLKRKGIYQQIVAGYGYNAPPPPPEPEQVSEPKPQQETNFTPQF